MLCLRYLCYLIDTPHPLHEHSELKKYQYSNTTTKFVGLATWRLQECGDHKQKSVPRALQLQVNVKKR